MAIRVALNDVVEGGQYALLKDVSELNAGDRRAIRGAVPLKLADDGTSLIYPGDYDDQMKNALLVRIVTEWNLSHTLPKNDPGVLDKLTIDQLDRLYDACGEHIEFLNKVLQPVQPGSDPT